MAVETQSLRFLPLEECSAVLWLQDLEKNQVRSGVKSNSTLGLGQLDLIGDSWESSIKEVYTVQSWLPAFQPGKTGGVCVAQGVKASKGLGQNQEVG